MIKRLRLHGLKCYENAVTYLVDAVSHSHQMNSVEYLH